MSAMFKSWKTLAVLGMTAAAAGCGDLATQGRSPAQLTIMSLAASSGASPDEFGATLRSDVITNVKKTVNGQQVDVPTIFNDSGTAARANLQAVSPLSRKARLSKLRGHGKKRADVHRCLRVV